MQTHRRRDNESKGVVPLFRSGTVRYPVTDTGRVHEIIDSRFPIPESSAKVASPYRYGGRKEGVGRGISSLPDRISALHERQ